MYEFARDTNITIPCTFTTTVQPPKSGVITWSRRPTDSTDPNVPFETILTFYYPDNSYDLSAGFDPKRFSVDVDFLKGKANLLINFLKLEDSTLYECAVQIRRDSVGKNVDTTNLVVLAAPSEPICEVQGIPQFGQNIHLICFSEEAFPAPQYKWQSHDVQNNLLLDPSSVAGKCY
ncbi:cell surface A33 antigen [Oryzias melastigma]|uniref:cell surface A33 antigen n=1 Tax=Oryzias melastigma TaxID=30732 RepID=UPI00168CF92B|nr:cell surface A33 antigen [Oryzias melastigma]